MSIEIPHRKIFSNRGLIHDSQGSFAVISKVRIIVEIHYLLFILYLHSVSPQGIIPKIITLMWKGKLRVLSLQTREFVSLQIFSTFCMAIGTSVLQGYLFHHSTVWRQDFFLQKKNYIFI